MSVSFCTVCKFEEISGRKKRWAFTSERTSVSQVQIIFKLYEILKHEFLAGSVCDECFGLLDQIDSLEFQVQAITKALKSRIDLASKDGEDDEEENISTFGGDRDRRKPSSSLLLRQNDDVEWDSDDVADTTYKPTVKTTASSKHPRHKRRKHSSQSGIESKRPRSFDDDNSVDDDPIDVNKFLANDGVRIKEERNFDDSFADYEQYQQSEGDASMGGGEKTFWDLVADPRVIDKALDTENVDYNVTMAQTTRGQEQLVYEGFTYKKYSYQDKQERVVKWKCSNYYAKKGKCPAKIATTPDGCCVLLDSKMDHNHEPDQSAIKIIMFRDRVKEMAVNHPDMKASEILANVEMLMDNPGPLGLKDESLMRYVQRVRSKQAKGEMGFKKVTYHRKKGYRWGMPPGGPSGPMTADESSSEKKPMVNHELGGGQDFQPSFLEHVRHSQQLSDDEDDNDVDDERHKDDVQDHDNSIGQFSHHQHLNNSELRSDSMHDQSVANAFVS